VVEKSNIVLVGPMGSGKSAVGRHLARTLRREFVDSDAEIEQRTGVDIAYIFEKEGESGFRQREREIIAELSARENSVIATGGGAVLDPRNCERLTSNGVVVYLRTTVAQQLERTRNSTTRPLLFDGDPKTVLNELMTTRAPLYEQTADIIVDTGGRRVGTVVNEITAKLREHGGLPLKK
jgi:shikimate kinase